MAMKKREREKNGQKKSKENGLKKYKKKKIESKDCYDL